MSEQSSVKKSSGKNSEAKRQEDKGSVQVHLNVIQTKRQRLRSGSSERNSDKSSAPSASNVFARTEFGQRHWKR